MSALTQTADTLFGVGNRGVREHEELRQGLELPRLRPFTGLSSTLSPAMMQAR